MKFQTLLNTRQKVSNIKTFFQHTVKQEVHWMGDCRKELHIDSQYNFSFRDKL